MGSDFAVLPIQRGIERPFVAFDIQFDELHLHVIMRPDVILHVFAVAHQKRRLQVAERKRDMQIVAVGHNDRQRLWRLRFLSFQQGRDQFRLALANAAEKLIRQMPFWRADR